MIFFVIFSIFLISSTFHIETANAGPASPLNEAYITRSRLNSIWKTMRDYGNISRIPIPYQSPAQPPQLNNILLRPDNIVIFRRG